MALLKNRLLNGALFAGALFGAVQVAEDQVPQASLDKLDNQGYEQQVRAKYDLIDHQRALEEARAVQEAEKFTSVEQEPVHVTESADVPVKAPLAPLEMLVAEVQSPDIAAEQAALEQQQRDNALALLLILSEV
jgi:hypothetical protein